MLGQKMEGVFSGSGADDLVPGLPRLARIAAKVAPGMIPAAVRRRDLGVGYWHTST